MTHNQQHVIIHRIREIIASWPLTSVGGTAAIVGVIGWLI